MWAWNTRVCASREVWVSVYNTSSIAQGRLLGEGGQALQLPTESSLLCLNYVWVGPNFRAKHSALTSNIHAGPSAQAARIASSVPSGSRIAPPPLS